MFIGGEFFCNCKIYKEQVRYKPLSGISIQKINSSRYEREKRN